MMKRLGSPAGSRRIANVRSVRIEKHRKLLSKQSAATDSALIGHQTDNLDTAVQVAPVTEPMRGFGAPRGIRLYAGRRPRGSFEGT